MPELGEIKKGFEIGQGVKDWRVGSYGLQNYIWAACENCGKERWTRYIIKKAGPADRLCQHCSISGETSSVWKGGRTKTAEGYILIKVTPDDFFYSMANKESYVLEHRLVMAQHLGRCLQAWEIVHHKNHIRHDNRIGNLQVELPANHKQITILEATIKRLQSRIKELELKMAANMAKADMGRI